MRTGIAVGYLFVLPFVLSALPARAETSIEAGTVSGRPGEKVRVPIYTDYDAPIQEVLVVFFYDEGRLRYLRFSVEGSEAADADPLGLQFNDYGQGQGLAGLRTQPRGPSRSYRVPPGRHLVGFLEFLVRATAPEGTAEVRPSRHIPAIVGGTETTIDTTETTYGSKTAEPDSIVPGAVTVLPPLGPRPVADLSCSQYLDRARLSFSPSEPYDEIEILRSGALVATLPGAAAAWEEELPGIGAIRYEVVARRAGEAALPASCDLLAVSPAAPPVRDLACEARGRLSWKNPVPYDEIAVWRDGAPIATLGGTEESYEDPEAPGELAVYTVVAALSGFRSPETTCISNGVWILEAGDVEVPAGTARVTVPIYATTSKTVRGWDAFIDLDTSVFTLVPDYEGGLEGSAGDPSPELYLIGTGPGPRAGPAVGMGWDYFEPLQPEKDLPPGLRQLLFRFTFEISGDARAGDVFPVTFRGGSFSLRPAVSQESDVRIPGSIRIGSPVAPVAGLAASVEAAPAGGEGAGAAGSPQAVRLSWKNREAYEKVRILRNGEVLAELEGGATEYRDEAVPGGVFTYKVSGMRAGRESLPQSALVSTSAPPGTFLRGDANRDGRIDISDAIAILAFLSVGGEVLPCEDAADADDSGHLAISDPILLLRHLFLGEGAIRAPGTLYPWFDPTPDGLACRR